MADVLPLAAGGLPAEEIILAIPDDRWYQLDAPQQAALEQALATLQAEAPRHGLVLEYRRDWERCRDCYVIRLAEPKPEIISDIAPVPAPGQARCAACGQRNIGQTGEYPCGRCGLPTVWDAAALIQAEQRAQTFLNIIEEDPHV